MCSAASPGSPRTFERWQEMYVVPTTVAASKSGKKQLPHTIEWVLLFIINKATMTEKHNSHSS